jgi:hypothetical protein
MDLDQAHVQLFECLEAYLEAREALHAALKDGHFHLARAKYSMGSLGQQQYPADMRAGAWISMRAGGDAPDAAQPALHLQRSPYPAAPSQPLPDSDDDDLDSAIQQELAAAGSSQGGGDGAAPGQPRRPRAPRRSCSGADAISWFGALPSPALKQAQSSFDASLQHTVSVATLAARLQQLSAAAAAAQPQASGT